ncbi:MAG TPA: hypothetical protein VHY79_04560 [Rhizomicrobium sp.]|jgi:hypothetical protein|nr:hypothetical protein [Rhizomicrobium sp.]
MMRLKIGLVSFLLVTTGAVAHPRGPVKPSPQAPVLLDLGKLHLFHLPEASDPATAQPKREDWSAQRALPNLSMGALHAQFGQDDNPWAHLQNYQSQLGGSAWEDQQNKSHSAKLMFVWPTGK